MEAAEKLAEKNVSAEVIDPRTLVPLDEDTIIKSVKKTNRLVVVDEGYSTCGVGAEIIARVQEKAFDFLDTPIKRLHPLNTPVPFSPVLEEAFLPDANKIFEAVMEIM
jgi:pyruvate dehydrogenase E1 component beta subunit